MEKIFIPIRKNMEKKLNSIFYWSFYYWFLFKYVLLCIYLSMHSHMSLKLWVGIDLDGSFLIELSQDSRSLLNNSSHVHLVAPKKILDLLFLTNTDTSGFASILTLELLHVDTFVAVEEGFVWLNKLLENRLLRFLTHFFLLLII